MRSRSRLKQAALCLAAMTALGATIGGSGSTYASFSDFAVVEGRVGAGVWAPDPPSACGDLDDYAGIIWGTEGVDTLGGGNHPQIIMGLGGDDHLTAGNGGDCLVGGPGDDHLIGGNARDILVGGAGDDFLDGGNGKDELDAGGDGGDVCVGGNGKNTVVNCSPAADMKRGPLTELNDSGTSDPVTPGPVTPDPVTPGPAVTPPDDPPTGPDDPAPPAPIDSSESSDSRGLTPSRAEAMPSGAPTNAVATPTEAPTLDQCPASGEPSHAPACIDSE